MFLAYLNKIATIKRCVFGFSSASMALQSNADLRLFNCLFPLSSVFHMFFASWIQIVNVGFPHMLHRHLFGISQGGCFYPGRFHKVYFLIRAVLQIGRDAGSVPAGVIGIFH